MIDKTQNTAPCNKNKRRSISAEVWRRLRKNKGAMIGLVIAVLLILMAITAPLLLDYKTDVINQNISERLQSPSLAHPFGTDETGRDIMNRIIYGSRYSLSVGFIAVTVSLLIGVPLGSIAGFYGGRLDNFIMRLADVFLSIPTFLLALVVVAAIGQSTFNLMLAVGVTSAPSFIRVTRASVLTARNQDYVEAARAIGVGDLKIIFRHVLPNSLSPIIVQATMRVGSAIITASTLSFLGMGVSPPTPEWGAMLSGGRKFIRDYSYMTLFPGMAIMITVLALNMFGDGLRDAIDPRLKR
ncbi:MAG: ABC transporter permease [Clostridiaceae bacterium]|nr:ABC transporter permease [Clostridiaceae bacterium]